MVRVVCCLITEIPQLNTTAEETSGCSVHKGLFLCEVIQCASRDNREKENTYTAEEGEKKWCSLSEEEYDKWRKKTVVEDLH